MEGNQLSSKENIIKQYARSAGDTGSVEVQVALLTSRIGQLTKHFELHRDDKHSKNGMLKLISQRKRMLKYIKDTDVERYRTLISSLGLRK
jgi:small subunit ribosomal protein S15